MFVPSHHSLRSLVMQHSTLLCLLRLLDLFMGSLTSLTPLWDCWNFWICVHAVNTFSGNKRVFCRQQKHALKGEGNFHDPRKDCITANNSSAVLTIGWRNSSRHRQALERTDRCTDSKILIYSLCFDATLNSTKTPRELEIQRKITDSRTKQIKGDNIWLLSEYEWKGERNVERL